MHRLLAEDVLYPFRNDGCSHTKLYFKDKFGVGRIQNAKLIFLRMNIFNSSKQLKMCILLRNGCNTDIFEILCVLPERSHDQTLKLSY